MIATAGTNALEIDEHWDIPRVLAWHRLMGGAPPLQRMVAAFLGYKFDEASGQEMSMEEHAARLIKGITGGR